jgi:hypothetical protein
VARLEILRPDAIADPELRRMAETSGGEMYGVYGHCPDLFAAFLRFYRPTKYRGAHRAEGRSGSVAALSDAPAERPPRALGGRRGCTRLLPKLRAKRSRA